MKDNIPTLQTALLKFKLTKYYYKGKFWITLVMLELANTIETINF